MNKQDPGPGSWQETAQSFSAMAGQNTDAARSLWLVLGSVVLIGCGWPLALVGLFSGLKGLVRSGRLGGRKAAVTGVGANAAIIATHVVLLLL